MHALTSPRSPQILCVCVCVHLSRDPGTYTHTCTLPPPTHKEVHANLVCVDLTENSASHLNHLLAHGVHVRLTIAVERRKDKTGESTCVRGHTQKHTETHTHLHKHMHTCTHAHMHMHTMHTMRKHRHTEDIGCLFAYTVCSRVAER